MQHSPTEAEQLPKLFEMAQATECSRATATVVPGSDEHAFKDLFELHRSRLDQIGSMAAKHDVAVGLAIVPEAERRAAFSHEFIHTMKDYSDLFRVLMIQLEWFLITGRFTSAVNPRL